MKRIPLKRIIQILISVCIIIITAGLFFVSAVVYTYASQAPALDTNVIEAQNETTIFYDRNGEGITGYFATENRIWAVWEELPLPLQHAFIAIEDVRFHQHSGIDFKRLAGSFLNNIKGGSLQGGSTLTQQLIKNTLLSSKQTYKRKIQEAALALQLEKIYTKEDILTAYLNTIYLGESNYGVKAAAMDYFGKEDLADLTLMESAILAGLTTHPIRYNPRKNWYGESGDPKATLDRAGLVLQKMLEEGYISETEYSAAINESIAVREEPYRMGFFETAHFIEYVIYEVRNEIMKLYGWDQKENGVHLAEEYIYTQGLRIHTTLDPEIQHILEDTLYHWEHYPKTGDLSTDEEPQAAAVITDQKTGQIVAMVGGRKPPEVRRELNRATQPLMVGSVIKPLSVFGPALDAGSSPGTIYHNIPMDIPGWDDKQAYPNNYGGSGFTGPVTMRQAVLSSYNTAAAQALVRDVGFENAREYLIQMGADPHYIQLNGSGLALGTSGISPLHLAGAYGTIANSGVYKELLSITRVLDRQGNVIVDRTAHQGERRVFDTGTAWLLNDMLEDVVSDGTGRRARIPGMTAAGKTGTNTDYKGVLFAGYTPWYTGVVWIGNDSGSPLASDAQGGRHAAPLWQAIMEDIHASKQLENKSIIDARPEDLGLVKVFICNVTGDLAGEYCPDEDIVAEWFHKDVIPGEVCRGHHVIQICEESGKFPNPHCPNDSRSSKTVYIPNADSPYRSFADVQLQSWIPGAYTTFNSIEEIRQLDYQNPDHLGHFCDIHTPKGRFQDLLEKWRRSLTPKMPRGQEKKLQ